MQTLAQNVHKNETLVRALKDIVGKANVLSSYEDCYAYSFDATNATENIGICDVVVMPSSTDEVAEILKFANKNSIPVVARCAGTNHVGACIPKKGGIVVSFAKMDKIIEINKDNLTCTIEPGVVVGDLQKEVEKMGLFYPPDPSNLAVSMIGGSIALSSAGSRTFKYGSTKDYVIDLEVVLADGSIIKTGSSCAKNVTGYNLTQLFVGSEGTLGLVTKATVKLIPKPEATRVMLLYFNSLESAVNLVNEVISHLIMPSVIDLMDKNTLKTIEEFYPSGLLTDKEAAILLELDGNENAISADYDKIIEVCKTSEVAEIRVANTKEEEDRIWIARRASFGASANLAPQVVTGDIVVPRDKIVELVHGIKEIFSKYSLKSCILGHIGDGNIHPNVALDPRNKEELSSYNKAKEEIFDLAIALGGTITGEHGIGCEKVKYMQKVLSKETISYMKQIKKMFDPKGILNPGKLFN